ncbi:endonuclease/exonuclease/phosphatase family protein [Vibrio sp. SS-MA-C1-2]|uniref:endonuclease/exonuclease/phosphatase family protein n=1 Tax=Vibrio sp. SS-MA-C1-2 TaxID=2908646 RepID=UPI001F2A90C6|nr:endonuclease/exonuclease/phosphatase family protein [Vibrio sp. SS-MA-C1-2]UJF19769.1 endonuclease/exonuclease/phosphatase family protein [Vibrio sp. SS-MA-C1-2]
MNQLKSWLKRSGIVTVFIVITGVGFERVFSVPSTTQVLNMPYQPNQPQQQCQADRQQIVPLDLDGQLDVTVWNIYKQKRPGVYRSLEKFTAKSQITLLQEASLTHKMKGFIEQHQLNGNMARAFDIQGITAGVMTLATIPALKSCAYRVKEPWLRLPKSALISSYPLSNGETIMVANLHGINFSMGLKEFSRQLNEVKSELALHHGPMLLSGDFNTWRHERVSVLNNMVESLSLIQVDFQQDNRIKVFKFPLDHLYYRGLMLKKSEVPMLETSDHNPLIASFMLPH